MSSNPLSGRGPRADEPAAVTATTVAPLKASRHLRILVVEDNHDAADTLRWILEYLGHEVLVAYTGPAGVQAALTGMPEVILCDIGLPGLDGYGVVKALRRLPEMVGVRMIALTAYGQDSDRRRSLEAGFDLHLTKPIDPNVLQEVLEGDSSDSHS
jgi:CheY-like chemotaxis protein